MQEMTSGVSSALKSWLAFGASLTGNKSKSVASVARESVADGPATSRLRVMFRQVFLAAGSWNHFYCKSIALRVF